MGASRYWYSTAALAAAGVFALLPLVVDAARMFIASKGGSSCIPQDSLMRRVPLLSDGCIGYPHAFVLGHLAILLLVALLLGFSVRAALRLAAGGHGTTVARSCFAAACLGLVFVATIQAAVRTGIQGDIRLDEWAGWGPAVVAVASAAGGTAFLVSATRLRGVPTD